MAVTPNRTPITRDQVHQWLVEFDGRIGPTKKLRDYLLDKISGEGHDGEVRVDTTTNDSLNDDTALVDMILHDLDSYG